MTTLVVTWRESLFAIVLAGAALPVHHARMRIGTFLACAVLLLLGQPLLAGEAPDGRYRLTGEPDVASELILMPGGRFQYWLSAGALDEHAEGRWIADGTAVRLYTEPVPVPAAFSEGPASKSDAAPLSLMVTWPDGRGIAGVDLRVGFDEGDPVEDYTQDYGWTLPASEARTPRWIEFAVSMHGVVSPRFKIDVGKANALRFILTPNDIGIADFRGALVETTDGELRLHRGDGVLRYIKPTD